MYSVVVKIIQRKNHPDATNEIRILNYLQKLPFGFDMCIPMYMSQITNREVIMIFQKAPLDLFAFYISENSNSLPLLVTKENKLMYLSSHAYQIFEMLCNLHENDIVHTDVKPDNIVCRDVNGKKLGFIDFGECMQVSKKVQYHMNIDEKNPEKQCLGTEQYRLPQIGLSQPYNLFANDLFCCGMTLLCLWLEATFYTDVKSCYKWKAAFMNKNWLIFIRHFFKKDIEQNSLAEPLLQFVAKMINSMHEEFPYAQRDILLNDEFLNAWKKL